MKRFAWLLAAFGLAAPLPAQDAGEATPEELTRLFQKIREDLREIDRLLLEAGGERKAAEGASSVVEEMRRLLGEAKGRERSVVEGIEEVIRRAPS